MSVRTIQDIRHANFLALVGRYDTLQAFANAIERAHSQVSQIKNRSRHSRSGEPRGIGDDLARHIETKLGLSAGWMDQRHDLEPPQPWGNHGDALAPHLSTHSPRILWGENMTDHLPAAFTVAAPDDSMAPRVRRGDVVKFTTNLDPRPGDGVLVEDDQGRWYLRIYRERRPGEWEAQAINEAYQPLHNTRDGLKVLAVLTGIEQQRWG